MLSIGPVFFPAVSAVSALGFFHPMDAHRRFQVSILSSLFFVYTYSVCFFGRMLASMYFAALVFRTKFFFCTSSAVLVARCTFIILHENGFVFCGCFIVR